MSSDRVHLSVAEARSLGERALRGIGYDAEEARIVCDHVIDAALCGYEYSGLAKILNIPEHRCFAEPRQKMRLVHETEVSALYDGGNNNGMIAMYHGARAAIDKARAHGISVIGISNSWMSGRSAYFVEMIAREGLVAIHTASSGPVVAPHGGTKGALGTNPIAFALPGEDGPLVLDIGTSAFMATELQLARPARPERAGGGRPRPRRQPDDRRPRDPRRRRAAAVRRLVRRVQGIRPGADRAGFRAARRRGAGGLFVHRLPPRSAGAAGRSEARDRGADRARQGSAAPAGFFRNPHPRRAVGAQPRAPVARGADDRPAGLSTGSKRSPGSMRR